MFFFLQNNFFTLNLKKSIVIDNNLRMLSTHLQIKRLRTDNSKFYPKVSIYGSSNLRRMQSVQIRALIYPCLLFESSMRWHYLSVFSKSLNFSMLPKTIMRISVSLSDWWSIIENYFWLWLMVRKWWVHLCLRLSDHKINIKLHFGATPRKSFYKIRK